MEKDQKKIYRAYKTKWEQYARAIKSLRTFSSRIARIQTDITLLNRSAERIIEEIKNTDLKKV